MAAVDREILKRVRARKLYHFINNIWGLLLTLVLPTCFFSFWLYGHITSPVVQLYAANVAAADEFVASVNAEWFFNKPLIAEKLEHMAMTYNAIGEDDPTKLGELRRLRAWTSAATSVADQQQFIAEVRQHGKVVRSNGPFYSSTGLAASITLILWLASALGLIWLMSALERIFTGRTQSA